LVDRNRERERGKALNMQYEISYQIKSKFITHVEADSEKDAEDKFRDLDILVESSESLLDGGLEHSEVEIDEILSTISAEVCQSDDLSGRNSRRAKLHELTHEDNY